MRTSPRNRIETSVLAVLAMASVFPMRLTSESPAWFSAELLTIAAFSLALICQSAIPAFHRRADAAQSPNEDNWRLILAGCIGLTPLIFAFLTRRFGAPIAFETSAMSTFGAAALAIALVNTTSRARAMSIVAAGFLVLFATSISDDSRAVILAIVWIALCVWHLVANHWEKLNVCMPDSVRPNITVRPVSVFAAVVVVLIGGLMVRDRFGPSHRFVSGFMPSSGGSKWSDPAARSGIGTGDAAIAAKDHAESFGAVESEIFLESTESTLFDMVNDLIGEAKKRKFKWERRQAIGNENVIPMHERAATSEQGGGSFSTDRMPPKKHRHFEDKLLDAVLQWDGPTGKRLALHRYDTFDGVDWTNTAKHGMEQLLRRPIDETVWFFDPRTMQRTLKNDESVSVNLLKVLRLSSPRLPAPMMTSGLHIKDVDRQDFFGIEDDGCFYMPGREKVPALTVINMASIDIMEDQLLGLRQSLPKETSESRFLEIFEQMDLDPGDTPYQQLRSIVRFLRSNFTFDRDSVTQSDDPLAEFLETRRGGDYLFATAAAVLAREVGLQSRIVTGFYVRPDSFDLTAGHANILPSDVHVWTEIRLDNETWFEIEPTPGYREPDYQPSWWLSSTRFADNYWPHGLAILAVLGIVYGTRLVWIEWLLLAGWQLARCLRPPHQLGIAMRIVETRARLVGNARPKGKPQRDWLESLVARDVALLDRVVCFCDAADRVTYGGHCNIDRRQLTPVVRGLKAKQLRVTRNEEIA